MCDSVSVRIFAGGEAITRNIVTTPERNPALAYLSLADTPQSPQHTSPLQTLILCGFAYSVHFLTGDSHNTCPFVSCCQGPFLLRLLSVPYSFLLPNSIPLYRHHIVSTCSSAEGHSGCSCSLAILNHEPNVNRTLPQTSISLEDNTPTLNQV